MLTNGCTDYPMSLMRLRAEQCGWQIQWIAHELGGTSVGDQLPASERQEMPPLLTEREKEVLRHLVNGWDAKRIGLALGISYLTIRKHMDNIYHKLHINSQAQAISLAHKHKWL